MFFFFHEYASKYSFKSRCLCTELYISVSLRKFGSFVISQSFHSEKVADTSFVRQIFQCIIVFFFEFGG